MNIGKENEFIEFKKTTAEKDAYSSGNPRMINNACHQSLLYAASNGKMQIDGQTITNVIEKNFSDIRQDSIY